jgi:hypothetical protein
MIHALLQGNVLLVTDLRIAGRRKVATGISAMMNVADRPVATVLPAIHVPAMTVGIAVTVRKKLLHAKEAGLPEVMISVKKEPAEAVPEKIHPVGIAVTVRMKLLRAGEDGLKEVTISVKKEPAEAVQEKIHHVGIVVTVRKKLLRADDMSVMNGILQMKNLHAVLQEMMMSVVPIHAMKNLLVISR